MQQITDYLYVGGKTAQAEVAYRKIKYTINISGVPCDYNVDATIPIADGYDNNKAEQIICILKEIDKARKEGKIPIFLMCHTGISRSPTVAALYLYYVHDFSTFDEPFGALWILEKTCTQFVNPNPKLVEFIKKNVIPRL